MEGKMNFIIIGFVLAGLVAFSGDEVSATPLFGTEVNGAVGYYNGTKYGGGQFIVGNTNTPNGRVSSSGSVLFPQGTAISKAGLGNNDLNVSFSGVGLGGKCGFSCYGSGDAFAVMYDTLTFYNVSPSGDNISIDLNVNYSIPQYNSKSGNNGTGSAQLLEGLIPNPSSGGIIATLSGQGSETLSMKVFVDSSFTTIAYTADIGGSAGADKGSTAGFIDPSITVLVPPGVTFTSASGATYGGTPLAATPEPPAGLLLGSGLLALAIMTRKNFRIRSNFPG